MFSKKISTAVVFLTLFLLKIRAVFAQEHEPKPVFDGGENPEKAGVQGIKDALGGNTSVVSTGNVRDLVLKYVNFALPFLALAAFLGFVYAGVLYITAFGNEEQAGKAKKVMIYAVIGLILVILSYSIVQLFTVGLAEGIKK